MQLLSHRNLPASPFLILKGKCRAGQGRRRQKPNPSLHPQVVDEAEAVMVIDRRADVLWGCGGERGVHPSISVESLEGPLSPCCGDIFRCVAWNSLCFKDLSVAFVLLAHSCSGLP